jgi:succinate-semialdehyde dehydrogenase/glutarate-semialdehyde dehydrogenase
MNISNPSLFKQQAFINGQWVDATDHQTMPIYNPSSNQLIGRVPVITAQQTQEAIRCAQAAWANWRDKPAKERSTVLRRWFDLILENQEDLATIITL